MTGDLSHFPQFQGTDKLVTSMETLISEEERLEQQLLNEIPPLNEEVVINFSTKWCQIVSTNSDLLDKFLHVRLAYYPDNYFFSLKYQAGVWDGTSRLYKSTTRRFKHGMLYRVIDLLKAAGCLIQIRNFPDSKEFELVGLREDLTPREYQPEACKAIAQYRFGIVKAPPRAGKTMIFTMTVSSENQFPVIFLVRQVDLAYQTQKKFLKDRPGIPFGIVGDGQCDIQDVTAVTFQSAHAAFDLKYDDPDKLEEKKVEEKHEIRKLFSRAKIVFVDECHTMVANSSGNVLGKCINANMIIGLSATPFSEKADAIKVEERIGPIIYHVTYSMLIKAGVIKRPHIYMYQLPKLLISGTYKSIYKQAIVDNEFLHQLVKYLVLKLNLIGKSVAIQTNQISYTKKLAKIIGCPYLIGAHKTEKRQELLDQLENKEIMCIVSTLLDQGIDIPTLDYTINLAGGYSLITTFQRMRSLTAHEDKSEVGVIDFFHRVKYLDRHANIRLDLYRSEPEFKIELRQADNISLEELKERVRELENKYQAKISGVN